MLTLAHRVAYQRAIEEVYWRHRIWPKERPDPKPSLDEVMPPAQLEKKVEDYLRNSEALEDYWQKPLSAEQLQAEMERIAQHTKQPAVLRELFEALGNDPYVIAECLARPALSERLATNLYAHDQRFHGELKRRAEADLKAHHTVRQMKQTSGKYSEIELIRSDNAQQEDNRGTEHGVKMSSREWDETVQKLAATFKKPGAATPKAFGVESADISARSNSERFRESENAGAEDYETIPKGKLSSLQEDEGHYYATAVVEKSKDRLKLATVEWRKEPFESWRSRAENQPPKPMLRATVNYMLPAISGRANGCTDDTWTATADAPSGRTGHTAVWTGSEMIVWGGTTYDSTGGRYNPSTDRWTATSTTNAPSPREYHTTAAWTGSEMIVWGGLDILTGDLNTGGRYNPSMDSWTATSTTNAPSARESHTAVWTGSEMIIWGGYDSHGTNFNTGGRYNPATDSWTVTGTNNAPSARYDHTAVWTGSEMIVWGGRDNSGVYNTGGRYNPSTDSWASTTTINAPSARESHTAIWSGSEMIIWGGTDRTNFFNTGGGYNPSTNSWIATGATNAPTGRIGHTAVWSGTEMIVWGGYDGNNSLNNGGRYNPAMNSWLGTGATNAPDARSSHTAIWSGSEMIVWGGTRGATYFNTGGTYDPAMDSWTATADAPSARNLHTAVWTGSEMIVWGGEAGGFVALNTGGIYNPATDSWAATSTINAPSARAFHTAVWTGSEMIVWGGLDIFVSYFNTGGRYNPGTDSWTATSTTNAPSARYYHTAVWTASEMIVWGGSPDLNIYVNTGGKYNPGTDTWTATSTTNAPDARKLHTAVWTGSEMIVWGGYNGTSFLNTGGRYNPSTDSWTATTITNAPNARQNHTAAWTGSEMIVWGGYNNPSYFNTGGRYNPSTDGWTATTITNAPNARYYHSAVWTGSEMIVWGGTDGTNLFNTGGRYNPSTDNWIPTSTTNAPLGRTSHTTVWTGSEMIIWGGLASSLYSNTGGRYCAQPPAQLGNISTRAFVQTGDNVMIGGFIVTGSGQKRVIVRAIGPSLVNHGITNPLQDPTLELHDHTGAVIAFNDNWMDAPNKQEIIDSGLAPSNNLESAILMSLSPGNYTAIVRGVNNGTGIALVEAYDLDQTALSKLGNISTRALVQTGDNVMIGGFIITGVRQKRVIVRAIGPSLAQYGITNPLLDPTLELHDGTGAVIAFNDNWMDAPNRQEIIDSGLAPSNNSESAILMTLSPGNYTAIVRGVNNTIGVALVEMYGLN